MSPKINYANLTYSTNTTNPHNLHTQIINMMYILTVIVCNTFRQRTEATGIFFKKKYKCMSIDLFAIISAPAQKRFRTAKLPDSIAKYCLHWLR